MRSQVLGTFALKLASALASFALLALTTQFLGASGRGLITLVVTTVGLAGLVNGFVGGASIVYLLSRNKGRQYSRQIIAVAYLWAAVSSVAVSLAAWTSGMVDASLVPHICFIGLLASATAINALLLLGAGYLALYNATNLLQTASTLLLFGLTALLPSGTSTGWYLAALDAAYATCLVVTSARLLTMPARAAESSMPPRALETVFTAFKYGGMAQAGNLLLYISYRLSFYILGLHEGQASVGIYSVAVTLSESLWMISGSFAIVLYAKAAHLGKDAAVVEQTIRYTKICLVVSLVGVAILLCVPQFVFTAIFGREFGPVRTCIAVLAVGMVSTSAGTIVNHYFAGVGMYGVNARIALIGFGVSVAGNLLLVPHLGLIGAGLTASASNLIVCVCLLRVFLKQHAMKAGVLLPSRADLESLGTLLGRR